MVDPMHARRHREPTDTPVDIFGQAKIGISSVIQPEGHEGKSVPLILMLHDAPNGAVAKALQEIGKLPIIKSAPVLLRVEDFN